MPEQVVRKLATTDRMPQNQVSALQGVQQVPLREKVIGTGPPPAGSTPRSSSSCPAAAFMASSSASSCADPRCSMSRDPRRDKYTN